MPLPARHHAAAAALVLEFPDGALEVGGATHAERVQRFAHLAARGGGRVEVEFDEHVEMALLRGGGDWGVGPHEGVPARGGEWVLEPDHEVLAHGETERLGRVLELEGQDDGVGGDGAFAGQRGREPLARVEEGGAGFVGGGGVGGWAVGDGCHGGRGEGADVIGRHHGFSGFAVDAHELIAAVDSGCTDDALSATRMVFHEGGAGVDFTIDNEPGVCFVVVLAEFVDGDFVLETFFGHHNFWH